MAAKLSAFGGGGSSCTICKKTSYPAETTVFDEKPYHMNCFKCSKCTKKLQPAQTEKYEGTLYCKQCWTKDGMKQKQTKVQWTPKAAGAAKPSLALGGGGTPCTSCTKTVYPAEAVQYEGKTYHVKCLKCSQCSTECQVANVNQYDSKLFCKKCFQAGRYYEKQAQVKWTDKSGSDEKKDVATATATSTDSSAATAAAATTDAAASEQVIVAASDAPAEAAAASS